MKPPLRTKSDRGQSGATAGLVDALETQLAASRATAANLLAIIKEEDRVQ
jgi:hypothetical protein